MQKVISPKIGTERKIMYSITSKKEYPAVPQKVLGESYTDNPTRKLMLPNIDNEKISRQPISAPNTDSGEPTSDMKREKSFKKTNLADTLRNSIVKPMIPQIEFQEVPQLLADSDPAKISMTREDSDSEAKKKLQTLVVNQNAKRKSIMTVKQEIRGNVPIQLRPSFRQWQFIVRFGKFAHHLICKYKIVQAEADRIISLPLQNDQFQFLMQMYESTHDSNLSKKVSLSINVWYPPSLMNQIHEPET
jgi:hypothetical protein